jgi:hypothetical protein
MSTTLAKTYRMPAGIHALITNEAEKLKTSEADIVRIALRHYFDDRVQEETLTVLEQRISTRIDAQGERLGHLIGEILKLAKP